MNSKPNSEVLDTDLPTGGVKLPYHAPKVLIYGDIRDVTLAFFRSAVSDHGNNNMAPFPVS